LGRASRLLGPARINRPVNHTAGEGFCLAFRLRNLNSVTLKLGDAFANWMPPGMPHLLAFVAQKVGQNRRCRMGTGRMKLCSDRQVVSTHIVTPSFAAAHCQPSRGVLQAHWSPFLREQRERSRRTGVIPLRGTYTKYCDDDALSTYAFRQQPSWVINCVSQ
jgi:hypothetical protein